MDFGFSLKYFVSYFHIIYYYGTDEKGCKVLTQIFSFKNIKNKKKKMSDLSRNIIIYY